MYAKEGKTAESLVSVDQNGKSIDPEYPAQQHPKNTKDTDENKAVRVSPKLTDK